MTEAVSAPKGHPKGLYLLFTVEMWERFSYYGMRAILFLYMTKALMFSTKQAGNVYGIYTGLVYLTPLLGGYLADRFLGQRRSIVIGALLMAGGEFALAANTLSGFYLGLALLIFGNGFFKPNISTVVGQLYERNDSRRDSAFTIFYMGINLGALFSPLVCGTLGERVGWSLGFLAAGVGMLLGLGIYLIGQKPLLGDKGLHPVARLSSGEPGHGPLTQEEREQVGVIFVLVFFSIFFWACFEQAGSSLTIFADKFTNRAIGHWVVPASWFQALNPLLIVLLAPFFSALWVWLAGKGKDPSTPLKFVLGLLLVALGFVLMVFASAVHVKTGQTVSLWWLTGTYLLHTMGELCLSPVGLSMVTKLAPARFASLLMGTWLLSSAAANYAGGIFAGNFDAMDPRRFFLIPVATAGVCALLLLATSGRLKRWMHGIH